ncbi:MAG: hypothetical protein NTY36_01260 [Deltaproteobacteria bacterium]|nr:hypothetical protein [Deltaproteobacteria bacterium]
MSYATIRDYLKDRLLTLPGLGVVHTYDRWAALVKLYVANDKFNGWHITRKATQEDRAAEPVVDRDHTYEIVGIYALNDAAASEKAFQELVEQVMALLRFDFDLGGHCQLAGPLKLRTLEPRMFGSVLCHVAVLELPAQEREMAP